MIVNKKLMFIVNIVRIRQQAAGGSRIIAPFWESTLLEFSADTAADILRFTCLSKIQWN